MSRTWAQLDMEPFYGFCHAIICSLSDIAFRGDVAGLENLPTRGGYIVASNHQSHLDPPIVGMHLPRQVRFFARKTLWNSWPFNWWLDAVGTIPVDRDGGRDVAAIRRVLRALEEGKAIILFPEGTRSKDGLLQEPKPGVGLFACKAQVPVVPARVFGSREAFGRGGRPRLGTPVAVTYGRPLLPAAYDDPAAGKDRYLTAAKRIMEEIAKLEPPRTEVL